MRRALACLLVVVLTILSPGPGAIQAFAALTTQAPELAAPRRVGQGLAFSGACAWQGAVFSLPRNLGISLPLRTPALSSGLERADTASVARAQGLAAQVAAVSLAVAAPLEAARLEQTAGGRNLDPQQVAQVLGKLGSPQPKAGVYAALHETLAAASPGRILSPRVWVQLGIRLYDGAFAQGPALAARLPVLGGQTNRVSRPSSLLAASQAGELGDEGRDPASGLTDNEVEAIALSLLQGDDKGNVVAAPQISALQREVDAAQDFIRRYYQEFDKDIKKQREMKETVLMGLLAHGHVLLEGPPGEGKTRAVKALARMLGLSFSRIQFTPDLLPSDIVGQDQWNPKTGEFSIRTGPLHANVVLADEINRAQPRTQSALLEAMAERQVTIAGETFKLDPFFVFATMNPVEQEAVFPLPEAQLDRFLAKVQVPYMDEDGIESVLDVQDELQAEPLLNSDKVHGLVDLTRRIQVDEKVKKYIARVIASTRPGGRYASELVKKYVLWGTSSRAAQMLQRAAQAQALMLGRSYVIPEDVKEVAVRVLAHRLVLNHEAAGNATAEEIVASLVAPEGGVPLALFQAPAVEIADKPNREVQPEKPAQDSAAEEASKPGAGLYEKLRAGFAASFSLLALSLTGTLLMMASGVSAETLNEPPPIVGITGVELAMEINAVVTSFTAALGMVTLGGLLLKSALPRSRLAKVGLAVGLTLLLGSLFLSSPWLIQVVGNMAGLFMVMAAGEEALFRSTIFLPMYSWFKEGPSRGEAERKRTELVAFIAAGAISSALFAAFHIPFHGFMLTGVVTWFAGGMLWAYLYRKSKDLTVPIVSHALYNITLSVVAGDLSLLWVPVVTALVLAAWGTQPLGSWWNSFKALLARCAAWFGMGIHAAIPLVAFFLIKAAWQHAQDLHWDNASKVMFPFVSLIFVLGAAMFSLLVHGLMAGWPKRPWFGKSASKETSFPSAYPLVSERLD